MEYPKDNFYSFIDPSNNASKKAVTQLLNLDEGYHYLILYPNIAIIRKIYTGYIGSKIKENNIEILFFTYYDTTDRVRQELTIHGLDVESYEKTNLTLVDHTTVLHDTLNTTPMFDGYKKRIQSYRKNQKNNLFIIADMSPYNHFKRTSDLLNFEKSLSDENGNIKWKQICLYHQSDFDTMFTDEQKQTIFNYHKDKTIII